MATDAFNDLSGSVSQLRSPALSAKTNATTTTVGLESKQQQQSHVSLTALALGRSVDTSSSLANGGATNGSMIQSQIFSTPITASPLAGVPPSTTVNGAEPHLAGHEPRYFPGVVQRRRGSTRQSSQHEGDENASKRFLKGKEREVPAE
jgi:hypothetical protein